MYAAASSHVTRNSSSSWWSSPPLRLENEFFGRFGFLLLARRPLAFLIPTDPRTPLPASRLIPHRSPSLLVSRILILPLPLPLSLREVLSLSSISGLSESKGTSSMEDYAWFDDVAGESDGELRWTLDGFADLLPASGYQNPCFPMSPLQWRCILRRLKPTRTKIHWGMHMAVIDKRPDRIMRLNCVSGCRLRARTFEELSAVLEPGRLPRSDKASILSDAARVLEQLRHEARQLKESNENLQDAIKDLKAEKNELRDEKLRLKADKEKLERQIKAQDPAPAKTTTTPYLLYPGVSLWPWLPRHAVDTSQDTRLWPPNA
ncbi:unnamed protein product [Spirodela intermedia]|uniref:Uncharacterized protein n=1 Tax=Spirodela intermedia TaxID=51605 RepID=A0A7I8KMV8_SPIIN|nr:unnamed protein product [Spirodela intermedia]